MTEPELPTIPATLGNLVKALRDADRDGQKELYRRLGVTLTYAKISTP
ncbi:hypothetical protein ACU686_09555 [Yinghuangia aomiensis]